MRKILRSMRLNGDVVDLVVEGKTISSICTPQFPSGPQDVEFQMGNTMVFPGFIDLQINGAFGFDFVTTPASIWDVGAILPRFGVTAFLPTVVTAPDETVDAVIEACQSTPANYLGAQPLGIHAEGPFLSPKRKGAHDASLIQSLDANPKWLRSPALRMMTLAPEREHADEVIAALFQQNVLVAAGHTDASAWELGDGVAYGVRYGTHLFNAMSGMHHREPGAAAALLVDKRVTCGIIVDRYHVDDLMVQLAWDMKGKNRFNLVSDAVAAAGMPDGTYRLADFEVVVKDGVVTLEDGTLAGSALTLDQAVRNLRLITDCSWEDAVHTVTTVPTQLLDMDDHEIAVGKTATLTCLSDEGAVKFTMIDGAVAFSDLD